MMVEDAPDGDEGERDDLRDGEVPRGFDPDGEDGFAESEREQDGGEDGQEFWRVVSELTGRTPK